MFAYKEFRRIKQVLNLIHVVMKSQVQGFKKPSTL